MPAPPALPAPPPHADGGPGSGAHPVTPRDSSPPAPVPARSRPPRSRRCGWSVTAGLPPRRSSRVRAGSSLCSRTGRGGAVARGPRAVLWSVAFAGAVPLHQLGRKGHSPGLLAGQALRERFSVSSAPRVRGDAVRSPVRGSGCFPGDPDHRTASPTPLKLTNPKPSVQRLRPGDAISARETLAVATHGVWEGRGGPGAQRKGARKGGLARRRRGAEGYPARKGSTGPGAPRGGPPAVGLPAMVWGDPGHRVTARCWRCGWEASEAGEAGTSRQLQV